MNLFPISHQVCIEEKKRFISPVLLRTASNKAAVPGRENLASKGFELKYSRQAPVGNNMDENE